MSTAPIELLWINALVAVPVALIVWLICRVVARSPVTRHALWVMVLVTFLVPSVAVILDAPRLVEARPLLSDAGAPLVRAPLVRAPMLRAPVESDDTVAGAEPVADAPAGRPPSRETRDSETIRDSETTTVPVDRPGHRPVVSDDIATWSGPSRRADLARVTASRGSPAPGGSARFSDDGPGLAPVQLASGAPGRGHGFERLEASEVARPAWGGGAGDVSEPVASDGLMPAPVPQARVSGEDGVGASVGARAPRRAPSRLAQECRVWLTHVIAVRDALAEVPPIPMALWAGGVGFVVLMGAARLIRDRRLFRTAAPAPAPVQRMVREAAARIGLRRVPRAYVVPTRVSPMVSCGWRPRVVLPWELWSQLDAESRFGVLLHELAHLRRRDHLLCWLESAIAALYWWHPVVWWVRRQIRHEADLCCDAWVTTLMPSHRRAYAEALLQTKTYISAPGRQPATGLGIASARTRHFARRLTMVMTKSVRPRMSAWGGVLTASVVVLATLVMPGIACPPKSEQKVKADTKIEVMTRFVAPRAPKADAPAPAPDETTFDVFMRGQSDDDRAGRVERLMQRLEMLEHRLDSLSDELGNARPRGAGVGTTLPLRLAPPPAPAAPPRVFLQDSDGTVARAYLLPGGRLDSLSELMVRQDVPILVSPEKNRLIVHATPAQHRVFESFARMICPEGLKVLDAETGEEIGAAGEWLGREFAQVAPGRYVIADARFGADEVGQLRSQAEMLEAQCRQMATQARQYERQAEQMVRQAERMSNQAERAESRADDMREKAEEALEAAMEAQREGDLSAHHRYVDRAAQYEQQSEALILQAMQLADQAEVVEVQADDMEVRAEEMEEHAEALEEEAEECFEQAEEIEEEWEDEHEDGECDDDDDECDDDVSECTESED